jgi:hypothetical protein
MMGRKRRKGASFLHDGGMTIMVVVLKVIVVVGRAGPTCPGSRHALNVCFTLGRIMEQLCNTLC